MNGVNRLATKGENYYWLPTTRKKLPTSDKYIPTDNWHGQTYVIGMFVFRKNSILNWFLAQETDVQITLKPRPPFRGEAGAHFLPRLVIDLTRRPAVSSTSFPGSSPYPEVAVSFLEQRICNRADETPCALRDLFIMFIYFIEIYISLDILKLQ